MPEPHNLIELEGDELVTAIAETPGDANVLDLSGIYLSQKKEQS